MKNSPKRYVNESGFTLIEIVVVVFIIGITITFASLSVSQHSDRYIEEEAKRLHHLIRLASEEAVFRSQEFSLLLTSTGYKFASLQGPKWERITDDRFFREREFPDVITVRLTVDEQDVNLGDSEKPAQIYMLSSGELTPPFTLTLKSEESEAVYKIDGKITGEVIYQEPDKTSG